MRAAALLLTLVVAGSACAPKARPAATPVPAAENPAARLAEANALLRIGCLECLLEANQIFAMLRFAPDVSETATAGAIQSAALIALRERGLGMSDSGYLVRARALLSDSDALRARFGFLLDIVDTTPPRIGRVLGSAADPETERRARILQQNRTGWLAVLSTAADADPLSAVTWVSFSCRNSLTTAGRARDALLRPLTIHKDAPVVLYEVATCANTDADVLQRLLDADARFHEIDYWLGYRELGRRALDEAQALLARAYEWHPQWPSAVLTLGGLFMTAEEFAPALEYYDRVLSLRPAFEDAMLGRVRALTYLDRSVEAIAAADLLLKDLPADAYYWRSYNKNQLEQYDAAWSDILAAEELGVTNPVAKLAGVIAYRRQELEVARGRFETATRLDVDDCDSHFFLGGVRAELRGWTESAGAYLTAVSCLAGLRSRLVIDIGAIEARAGDAGRKARRIASRQQKIALIDRMMSQSRFNIAVASFNLGRSAQARQYAEMVLDDEQYSERARALISGLKP